MFNFICFSFLFGLQTPILIHQSILYIDKYALISNGKAIEYVKTITSYVIYIVIVVIGAVTVLEIFLKIQIII